MLCLRQKSSAKWRRYERIYFFTHLREFRLPRPSLMRLDPRDAVRFSALRSSAEILAGAANPYHAAGTRRVSAAGLAPGAGEVVTQFQSDSARTDSPVRVLNAQAGSPVSKSVGGPSRPRDEIGRLRASPDAVSRGTNGRLARRVYSKPILLHYSRALAQRRDWRNRFSSTSFDGNFGTRRRAMAAGWPACMIPRSVASSAWCMRYRVVHGPSMNWRARRRCRARPLRNASSSW
jgi:hypothetical protein